MLSGFTSYFFTEVLPRASNPPVKYESLETDGDWVLVDAEDCKPCVRRPCKEKSIFIPRRGEFNSVSSWMTSSQSSDTFEDGMEGSWYITPPPCFTAKSPTHLETSPLENLLIEHPSMSVYGQTPPSSLQDNFLKNSARDRNVLADSSDEQIIGSELYISLQHSKEIVKSSFSDEVPTEKTIVKEKEEVCDWELDSNASSVDVFYSCTQTSLTV